ncbi:MAG TPA: metal-sulfur cluster assembly factor [Longimicrobiales bacterium]|nr:metal-sulfur cluster assembly factor [Longimicrobiales bacterium]
MGLLKNLWTSFRRGRAARRAGPGGSPAHHRALRPSNPATNVETPPAPGIHPVWDALRRVVDPEVGLDIVSMGLVFGVALDGDEAVVTYTLTTPGCPMADVLTRGILAEVGAVPGVRRVTPRLVREPAWHPGMIHDNPTLEQP